MQEFEQTEKRIGSVFMRGRVFMKRFVSLLRRLCKEIDQDEIRK